MAFLFLIFLIICILIYMGYRQTAIVLTLINFIFMLAMFYHHITTPINVQF